MEGIKIIKLKKYIDICSVNLFLIIDAFLLALFSNSNITIVLYMILNTLLLSLISLKLSLNRTVGLILFIVLTYGYTIEVMIHYLNIDVFLDARYLYLVPTSIAFLKTIKRYNIKNCILPFLLILFYSIITLVVNKVTMIFYLKTILPYLSAIFIYYIFKYENINIKPLYKLIYILCFALMMVQTLLGFHTDTRNGLFGVFGFGAYSLFCLVYPIYMFSKALKKNEKYRNVFFSVLISIIIFICTENKMLILMFFVILALITLFSKKYSIKNWVLPIGFALLVPVAYKFLIHFIPRFAYLTSYEQIYNYFFGNNNWLYEYGRFESLNIVLKNVPIINKIFGIGFGVSTPLDTVFLSEVGEEIYLPYYIKQYGLQHGFHLTGLSTVILDGGFFMLFVYIIYMINNLKKAFYRIRSNCLDDVFKGSLMLAVSLVFIYYTIYTNSFASYKSLIVFSAIIGIVVNKNTKIIKQ